MDSWINTFFLFHSYHLFSPSSQATRQTGGGLDTQESAEILQGLYLMSGRLKQNKEIIKQTKTFLTCNYFIYPSVLQSHSWQPGIKNPYRGVVVWPVPENIEITVTLFKVGHSCFSNTQTSISVFKVDYGCLWTWGSLCQRIAVTVTYKHMCEEWFPLSVLTHI